MRSSCTSGLSGEASAAVPCSQNADYPNAATWPTSSVPTLGLSPSGVALSVVGQVTAHESDGAFLQFATLTFGQATPDPEALVVLQGVLKALTTDVATEADLLGLPGRAALLRKESLRIGLGAQRPLLPVEFLFDRVAVDNHQICHGTTSSTLFVPCVCGLRPAHLTSSVCAAAPPRTHRSPIPSVLTNDTNEITFLQSTKVKRWSARGLISQEVRVRRTRAAGGVPAARRAVVLRCAAVPLLRLGPPALLAVVLLRLGLGRPLDDGGVRVGLAPALLLTPRVALLRLGGRRLLHRRPRVGLAAPLLLRLLGVLFGVLLAPLLTLRGPAGAGRVVDAVGRLVDRLVGAGRFVLLAAPARRCRGVALRVTRRLVTARGAGAVAAVLRGRVVLACVRVTVVRLPGRLAVLALRLRVAVLRLTGVVLALRLRLAVLALRLRLAVLGLRFTVLSLRLAVLSLRLAVLSLRLAVLSLRLAVLSLRLAVLSLGLAVLRLRLAVLGLACVVLGLRGRVAVVRLRVAVLPVLLLAELARAVLVAVLGLRELRLALLRERLPVRLAGELAVRSDRLDRLDRLRQLLESPEDEQRHDAEHREPADRVDEAEDLRGHLERPREEGEGADHADQRHHTRDDQRDERDQPRVRRTLGALRDEPDRDRQAGQDHQRGHADVGHVGRDGQRGGAEAVADEETAERPQCDKTGEGQQEIRHRLLELLGCVGSHEWPPSVFGVDPRQHIEALVLARECAQLDACGRLIGMRLTVLAGGIGGATFLRGLVQARPDAEITVIGNTADDITLFGLRVCPDLDTVMYTLGGGISAERGWGRDDEGWLVKEARAAYCVQPTWFGLGDRDVATHLVRTQMLDAGYPLTAITEALCDRWKLPVRLIPMSDDRVETHVVISDDEGARKAVHFQEYWVRLHAEVPAHEIVVVGQDKAQPAPGVLDAIAECDVLLLPPSNPVVSVGTILGVPGILDAVRKTAAPVVGVSPIIGEGPVRGMADKVLAR